MRVNNFKKSLLFLILFAIFASVYSEGSDHKTIAVLLSSHTIDDTELYSFEDIINYTISFELTLSGFIIIISKDIESTEELLKEAGNQGASFLIKSSHSVEGGSLEIVLDCFRVSDGKIIFSVSKEIEINLGLDSTIKEMALEIIASIKEDMKINPTLLMKTEEVGSPGS